ncbi:hypothetical protein BASA50_004498 [Batrachochytrium salamandrivorans]|uniref:SLM1/RGC1-like BAR-like domain-containing protein n=1 Tax=Batrachochytrium salamandrivorans TaxID=1357716 RepID=A0ABQ8FI86_9FUNG|nr:hypothetical protein BASA61_004989 [Batrachochytrium salamandrivorans]KAH6597358.1 hypothetical protein BASA50_004498 [Batrachochytrium salamandrivorans]KAH9276225.1 hypothetical protein BASA83_001499 [Batrachochytrium salamandrivorans]
MSNDGSFVAFDYEQQLQREHQQNIYPQHQHSTQLPYPSSADSYYASTDSTAATATEATTTTTDVPPRATASTTTKRPKGNAPFADNPSQGLVPLSATEICLRRMNGWARIVYKLIRYLEIVAEQEQKLSESMAKCSHELSFTGNDRDGLNIFDRDESFQMILKDMADMQTKVSREHSRAVELVQTQLLPILKELLAEIRKKIADADKDWGVLDKEMKHDLDLFVKLSAYLRASLMRIQWKGDDESGGSVGDMPKDVPKDPWLADRALKKHITHCNKKQDYYRTKLLQQQDTFAAFEKVIVQNIRVGLASFYEWKSSNSSRKLEQSRDMARHLDSMEADKDWAIFKRGNCDRFIDVDGAGVPLVQISSIVYDGFDDPAIRIVRQGPMLRKEGVFKRSYRPVHIVLTASGYFHCLPPFGSTSAAGTPAIGESSSPATTGGSLISPVGGSKPDFNTVDALLEAPELSLDLAECTMAPLNLSDKDPEDIVIVGKGSGMFGRESKHKFKGNSMVDSADWWTAINDHMKKVGKRSLAMSPPPSSTNASLHLNGESVRSSNTERSSTTLPPPSPSGVSSRSSTTVEAAPGLSSGPSSGPSSGRSLHERLNAAVAGKHGGASAPSTSASILAPPLPQRVGLSRTAATPGSLIDKSFDDLPHIKNALSPPLSPLSGSGDLAESRTTATSMSSFASFPPPPPPSSGGVGGGGRRDGDGNNSGIDNQALPERHTTTTASVDSNSMHNRSELDGAHGDLSVSNRPTSGLSLSAQMELRLNAAVGINSHDGLANDGLHSSSLDAGGDSAHVDDTSGANTRSTLSNPWDTFQDESGGW